MTKAELVDAVAKKAEIPKATAARAIAALFDSIASALKQGDKVTLVGFGTFSVAKRNAREGRNPKTGEKIKIPAARVPKFSAGKSLKELVS